VEELILSGQVRINGQPVTNLATQVQPGDSVKVGRRLLRREQRLTVVMYKPKGYLCTAHDDQERKTIFDLLPTKWPRVFHVGRLDMDSEGLLILTNDGDLANAMTHPRFKVEKEYEVTLDRAMDPALLPKLLNGVHIEGGRAKAEHAVLEAPTHLRLVLTQGLNRQIHKMLWRVGEYDVKRLARVRIGPVTIRGLEPGRWRVLTAKEIAALVPEEKPTATRRPRPSR
jgi:23S rRNA pseudouridine2605 synthase